MDVKNADIGDSILVADAVPTKSWLIGKGEDGRAIICLELEDGKLAYRCLDADSVERFIAALRRAALPLGASGRMQ